MRQYLRRLAAIGEVIAVLVAGVLGLRFVLSQCPASWSSAVWSDPRDSAWPLALGEALTISLHFILLIASGFLLLWLRFRVTPAQAGAGRGGRSLAQLAFVSIPVAALGAAPWKAVVAWNMYAGAGEGLRAWDRINAAGPRLDVIALVLASAVVLPPLFEELFARGYMRTRLALAFGPACGVVVAALVFVLSHGHLQSADGVVQMQALCTFFAAAVYGWAAFRTGSVLPGVVGHAILNTPEPSDPIAMAAIAALLVAITLASSALLLRECARFAATIALERWRHLIWSMPLLAAVFVLAAEHTAILLAAAFAGFALTIADAVAYGRQDASA